MTNSVGSRLSRVLSVICVMLAVLVFMPSLSRAGSADTAVNIVNNSGRDIRNVYVSHVDADDWSNDLLDAKISSGQSRNVTGIQCDSQQMKVIAEDQDGCFLSTVVQCGTSGSWTITNDTPRDCGY